MNIHNKYLNISTEDINKETDIFKLKEWLLDIEENIMTLGIALERLSSVQDQKWQHKSKTARKYQIILKGQIQNRLSFLKSRKSYEQILIVLLKEKLSPLEVIELETKAKEIVNGYPY